MQPHPYSTPFATLLVAVISVAAGTGSGRSTAAATPTPDAAVDVRRAPLPGPSLGTVPDSPPPARPAGPQRSAQRHTTEPAAHSWLSDRVDLLYRRTGLTGDERAIELVEMGDVETLVNEARVSGNAFTHARYFVIAASHPAADRHRIGRLLEAGLPEAGAARTSVLLAVGEWMRRQPEVDAWIFNAHLEAAATVRPGSARRRALADLLAVPALDGPQVAQGIRTMARVTNSSAGRADLLITAAAGRTLTGEARAAWIQAARAIPVRSHRDRTLAALR
jgi:hypothetical protein